MFAAFFSKRGLVEAVMLENKKTVTADWYVDHCFPKVFEALKTMRPISRMNTWFFHQDNTPAHRASKTNEFLEKLCIKLLSHPPNSPDLVPPDFGLFPITKRQLKGRLFDSEEELINALTETINYLPDVEWSEIFDEWFKRMRKCILHAGGYFEKNKN